MKRFQFQLASVLDFKQQTLDSLMIELSNAQAETNRQLALRDKLLREMNEYSDEYNTRKLEGLTALEALEYQECLRVLERRLKREEEKLKQLRRKEEAKRLQVVEARKETHSLEKLRDIRRSEYDHAAQKAEEVFIEDLTAARRSLNRAT